ncbi:MAG: cobalamin-independent methionine synthase II family protein [Candidatus Omnitrophica bacterium]|nr:cobalamin-independent methionine synthase II family protein [Candidatus Omnitrophota bacterium]MCB9781739.1 cobalamin-independent methionine synthase II family protein [Candidatus Omnitrophota bacterium]
MEPKIKTTVVGSYPVPDWLAALPSEQALIDATSVVFKIQENAGIDLVADGELYRFDINHPDTNGMIDYFVRPLSGVRSDLTLSELRMFRADEQMAFRSKPAGVVVGEIKEGGLNLPEDYRRARALTKFPMKFTTTGPHMLCKTLVDLHYESRRDLCMAIAQVLADQVSEIDSEVVQIDEANLTGHPEDSDWALECINVVLDAVPTTPAVHLCFGNYGGQTIQAGDWGKLIEFLSGLHCDHVLLEVAHRGNWELDRLKEINPDVKLGFGVVDIKTNVVETAEDIARKLEEATGVLGEDRIGYINPDCGFWMLKRSVADRKIRALVAGRDLFEGRQ